MAFTDPFASQQLAPIMNNQYFGHGVNQPHLSPNGAYHSTHQSPPPGYSPTMSQSMHQEDHDHHHNGHPLDAYATSANDGAFALALFSSGLEPSPFGKDPFRNSTAEDYSTSTMNGANGKSQTGSKKRKNATSPESAKKRTKASAKKRTDEEVEYADLISQEDVESEADDDGVPPTIFSSLAAAKSVEFERTSLTRDASENDDWISIKESRRAQKVLVHQIEAAMSDDFTRKPMLGGERFSPDEQFKAWRRFQRDHVRKVEKIIESEGVAMKREKAAWLLLDALFDARKNGIRVGSSGVDAIERDMTFSERAQACIEVIGNLAIVALDVLKGEGVHKLVADPERYQAAKVTNVWVNHGKRLAEIELAQHKAEAQGKPYEPPKDKYEGTWETSEDGDDEDPSEDGEDA